MDNKEFEVYKEYMHNVENAYKCNTCPENHHITQCYGRGSIKPCGEKDCLIMVYCTI